jgi:hypothetical protein
METTLGLDLIPPRRLTLCKSGIAGVRIHHRECGLGKIIPVIACYRAGRREYVGAARRRDEWRGE